MKFDAYFNDMEVFSCDFTPEAYLFKYYYVTSRSFFFFYI